MSIKPVDFQVMLPKTAEISKIHSDEQNKNQAVHQQQAVNTQHKAEDSLRQVHSQEKAQEARIREKQEKEKREQKKKEEEEEKKDSSPNYNKNKKLEMNNSTSRIDIRL